MAAPARDDAPARTPAVGARDEEGDVRTMVPLMSTALRLPPGRPGARGQVPDAPLKMTAFAVSCHAAA